MVAVGRGVLRGRLRSGSESGVSGSQSMRLVVSGSQSMRLGSAVGLARRERWTGGGMGRGWELGW